VLLLLLVLGLAAVGSSISPGTSPEPVARIQTGTAPCDISSGFGAMWVVTDGAGRLVRVDPRSNRVTRRIRMARGACGIALGAGAIWVTSYRQPTLLRIDPRTSRVRRVRVGRELFDVLVAYGSVWVTSRRDGVLVQIAPRSLRVLRRIKVGPDPAGLHAAAGAVWVGSVGDTSAISRVDPSSGAVQQIPVGDRRPAWFVAGTRELWLQANDHDLVHVDAARRRVLGRLRFGRTLAQGAAAPDDMLWIPDKEQSVVYRIDPAAERVVDSFPAGRGAFVARRAFGSMWVTSYAGSDVWRFRSAAGRR
jgi:streptogramin lyase